MIPIVTTLSLLTGFLTVDHQPAANVRVLVIDAQTENVIYAASTDSTGNFYWEYPEEMLGESVYVIGKFESDDILTSEWTQLILSDEASFSLNASTVELLPLTIQLTGPSDLPTSIDLHLHALAVDGIPNKLIPFLFMHDTHIGGSYYSQRCTERLVKLRIKKGRYSVNALYIIVSNPSSFPPPTCYETASVNCNGKDLAANRQGVFELEITDPATIGIRLKAQKQQGN